MVMADPYTWVAIGSLVLGGVSAGVNYSAQKDQAETQAFLAEQNARIDSRNAALRQRTDEINALVTERQLEAEARANEANASQLEAQGEQVASRTRSEISRQRDEFRRVQARQRARIAKSGVVESGTPLAILGETAGQVQVALEEIQFQGEGERRQLQRRADLERFNGSQNLFDANIQKIQGSAAAVRGTNALRTAEINRLAGVAGSRATRQRANASLISSGASLFGNASNLNSIR